MRVDRWILTGVDGDDGMSGLFDTTSLKGDRQELLLIFCDRGVSMETKKGGCDEWEEFEIRGSAANLPEKG